LAEPDKTTSVRELLARASRALAARDFKSCEACLGQAQNIEPGHSGISALLGTVFLIQGRCPEARLQFEASLKSNPRQPQVLTQLATARLRMGDKPGFSGALDEALGLDPENLPALRLLAGYLMSQGDYGGAVDASLRAIRRAPRDAASQILLGQALYGRRDWDGAERAYRAAQELDPANRQVAEAIAALERVELKSGGAPRTESPFDGYRRAAAERPGSLAAVRPRLAWMAFRRLFNSLIYDPVADGHPAMGWQWQRARVSRSRFEPILEWLDEPGGPSAIELPLTMDLPRAFEALERLHDLILGRLAAGTAGVTSIRSWETRRRERAPLPQGFAMEAAVDALERDLREAPASIAATLLHGSLADGLVAGGFSDADVICFVGRPMPGGRGFWEAAQWLFSLNHRLLAINPCMHHGPMIAFAGEIECAAEAALPAAVIRNGVWCKGGFPEAAYHDGTLESVASVGTLEEYFEAIHLIVPDLRCAFDVLWWASSALFLPLLLQQAETGESIYKRECLELKRAPLPDSLWGVLQGVSEVRLELGRWMASRLPAGGVEHDRTANPGRTLVDFRRRLSLAPEEVRGLGITDPLMQGVRQLWEYVRNRSLEVGYARLGGRTEARPVGWTWPRKLTGMPRRLGHADYDRARAAFLDRCRGRAEVRAVFEFGEVGCPGLSDLDFCVVLGDGCLGVPEDLLAAAFPEDVAYLVDHDPLFVSASAASSLGAVFPVFSARQLWGEPFEIPLSATLPRFVQAAAITYKNLRKYPASADGLFAKPEVNLRTALAVLHSSAHIKRCLESLGIAPGEGIEAAVSLDRNWRSRFAAGETPGPGDVLAVLDACGACNGPLVSGLVEFWTRAAAGLPDDGLPRPSRGPDAARWILGELGLDAERRRNPAFGPSLQPLVGEYLAVKRRFVEFERSRGRIPSDYIEDPDSVLGPSADAAAE
jgi:Flp pilus assembly protein TadD